MDFKDLAKARYSLRKFSDKPIEKEKLDLVLEAGRNAPTAVNHQPQRIVVITDDYLLSKIKECTQYHFEAKTIILVCYDKTKAWVRPFDKADSGEIDATVAITQMMLQAADIGLGTTFVGFFDPQKLRQNLSIPEDYVPVALLPIGYPAESAKPAHLHEKRMPIEEMVTYNKF